MSKMSPALELQNLQVNHSIAERNRQFVPGPSLPSQHQADNGAMFMVYYVAKIVDGVTRIHRYVGMMARSRRGELQWRAITGGAAEAEVKFISETACQENIEESQGCNKSFSEGEVRPLWTLLVSKMDAADKQNFMMQYGAKYAERAEVAEWKWTGPADKYRIACFMVADGDHVFTVEAMVVMAAVQARFSRDYMRIRNLLCGDDPSLPKAFDQCSAGDLLKLRETLLPIFQELGYLDPTTDALAKQIAATTEPAQLPKLLIDLYHSVSRFTEYTEYGSMPIETFLEAKSFSADRLPIRSGSAGGKDKLDEVALKSFDPGKVMVSSAFPEKLKDLPAAIEQNFPLRPEAKIVTVETARPFFEARRARHLKFPPALCPAEPVLEKWEQPKSDLQSLSALTARGPTPMLQDDDPTLSLGRS